MRNFNPCPKCGSRKAPQLLTAKMAGVTLDCWYWCRDCDAHTMRVDTEEEARNLWNSMADKEAKDNEIMA